MTETMVEGVMKVRPIGLFQLVHTCHFGVRVRLSQRIISVTGLTIVEFNSKLYEVKLKLFFGKERV